MIGRLLRGLGWLVLAAVLFVVGGLGLAHREMRSLDPELPAPASLEAPLADAALLPARLSVVITASQEIPRSGVLDPVRDPDPGAPYVMSHAAFVLEWEDGRLLLIDTGMNPDEARRFGAPLTRLVGAKPMVPHGSVADGLGDAVHRVRGLVITHLHSDHTSGAMDLCAARATDDPPVALYQTRAQVELRNFTTRPGAARVDASPCLEHRELAEAPLAPLSDFPGVAIVRAAGHTPDSEVVIANVRTPDGIVRWAFSGDVVNNVTGIRDDVSKPPLYSLLLVPEWDARLGRMRRFLRELERDHGFRLAVSHDEHEIRAAGIPDFRS